MYENVNFPGWEVVRKIGEGSFGGVYEIHRTLPDGRVEKAALKKLTVPKDNIEIRELYSQSFSRETITAHYKEQVRELAKEYTLTQELNSCKNVVACHDVQCVQHADGIGWDIYIRMELLKPLKLVLSADYQEMAVLKLGLSLCNALLACQEHHIVHRDIKPAHFAVSPLPPCHSHRRPAAGRGKPPFCRGELSAAGERQSGIEGDRHESLRILHRGALPDCSGAAPGLVRMLSAAPRREKR